MKSIRTLPAFLAILVLSAPAVRSASTPAAPTNESPAPWPAFPLPVPQERSAATRRAAKPALETRVLDDLESTNGWSLHGPGRMALTEEHRTSGLRALRLTSPTKLDKPGPVEGRPFAETGVRRNFAGSDWSAFNRVSVWVRPHLPGFHTISLVLKLHAAGSDRWMYTFGHLHYVLLENDRWNCVVWEIPHLPRTQVTALDLTYRLQGHEPGATDTVQFDIDDLRLERVATPDPWRGWNVAPGDLAYCHLGYLPAARKEAVAAPDLDVDTFELVPAQGGDAVFRGPTRRVSVPDPGAPSAAPLVHTVLDFTAFRNPGLYRLRVGNLTSEPFPIGPDIDRPALVATLNQYACQRCGEPVPGIHGACHQDWQVAHGNRRLPIFGGWHDAGDLSQGLVNTSEATSALLAAAERLGLDTPHAPGRRFLTEARHGLAWIHRTRFGDGHRATWATMDFWTDGVFGNADDVVARAGDSPFENLLAATASARAARVLRPIDPAASAQALEIARQDLAFALGRVTSPTTDLAAAAIRAGTELLGVAEDPGLRNRLVSLGRQLLLSQETNVPASWTVPLSGYFYTSPDRRRPHRFEHRGHNEGPTVALAALARALPDHPDCPAWLDALARHVRYLRQTAELTGPWHMPAAGIYRIDRDDEFTRRQAREGIRLDDVHYLRRFPAWGEMRGNSGILLSQAHALAVAARLLRDAEAGQLARTLVEWHLGRNPFAQSLMYGVGHRFTPQYTAMSGDITGGLPVGIQTRGDEDIPYWPASNCYNFAEIWIHPSSRLLDVLTELGSADY